MSNSIPFNQTTTANISVATSGTGYAISSGWSNLASTAHTDIQSRLKVHGDAEFEGDIVVKGRSLTESLTKIEERLAILPAPNRALEQDWSELAELRQQYVELERQLLEKQRVFDILKKQ